MVGKKKRKTSNQPITNHFCFKMRIFLRLHPQTVGFWQPAVPVSLVPINSGNAGNFQNDIFQTFGAKWQTCKRLSTNSINKWSIIKTKCIYIDIQREHTKLADADCMSKILTSCFGLRLVVLHTLRQPGKFSSGRPWRKLYYGKEALATKVKILEIRHVCPTAP